MGLALVAFALGVGIFGLSDDVSARASVADHSGAAVLENPATEIDPDVVWGSNGTGMAVSAAIVDRSGAVLTGQVVRVDEWGSEWDVPELGPVFCRVTFLWDGADPDSDGAPMINSVVDEGGIPGFLFSGPLLVLEKDVPAFGLAAMLSIAGCRSSESASVESPPDLTSTSGRTAYTTSVQESDPELPVLVTRTITSNTIPGASLGTGRLMVSGTCVAFESDADDEEVATAVWPNGSIRWVAPDVLAFTSLENAEEVVVSLGQSVELGGIGLREGRQVDRTDRATDECPSSAVEVFAVALASGS